jgi:N-acetylmuramoyl-L-alanine amidase
MAKHTVKRGEDLSSVTELYGFSSWKTLQDDPGNAALKKKRPNPNLLVPKDVVAIPSKKKKTASAQTGGKATLKLALPKTKLRLFLRSAWGDALASAAYKLEVHGHTIEGSADGNGLLEEPVPTRVVPAILVVTLPDPPAPQKPPDDGLVVPKETFTLPKEPDDPALTEPEAKTLTWRLTLGTLQPADTVVGQQNRLHNLGYRCAVDGIVGPETTAAAHAFQDDRGLTVGDIDDATKNELVKVHDTGAT